MQLEHRRKEPNEHVGQYEQEVARMNAEIGEYKKRI